MNAKKAKRLRRQAANAGSFKKEADYKMEQSEKIVYAPDKEGVLQAHEITRTTIVNTSKIGYRQLKKDNL